MKRRQAALALAGAALAPPWLLAQVGSTPRRDAAAQLAVQRWPALTLHDLEGRPYLGLDGGGRVRIVNVWARWCAPCRRELPSLQRLAERLDGRQVELITIALDDDPFALREFARELRLRLPILRGEDAQLRHELKIRALPQTLVVDGEGFVRRRLLGARDWDRPEQRSALLGGEPGDGAGV